MPYSYDDQYNVLLKSTSNLSSSNDHIMTDFAAIDYFQFDFNELQLHNCWKLVHRQRINEAFIPQSTDVTRLENLSWRRWTKMKYSLQEVSPEVVDWFKDSDITWLYGPLVSSGYSNEHSSCAKSKKSILNTTTNTTASQTTPAIPFDRAPNRNNSVSSLSSTSSVDSSPFYSDSSDYDEETDESLTGDVKPILKHRYSYGPLGFESFERLRNQKVVTSKKFKKSVSFADMVQVRQF
ncbi:CYFA0S01e09032g1_1 [Cyberlindnera fabianii]|uniref:CYFA0S01e09032g1_1 n=1 Tax=Cyberlindnera fabianii TaxID=36022 RepID=A0A061APF3_CYBFA|nr:Resistance to glucose repression protein 1 [Cyberlindnera fabianii]CDR37261.1 CYFA0S01e09032g1_1 [Cyberlindnera fabianii]